MASSRAQSLLPRGSGSPGFTVTRVVTVLLMSRGLPGRYDPARILTRERHDNKQHLAVSHSDDLNPLPGVDESRVYLFQTVGILEGSYGVLEINAMLAAIRCRFAAVPLVMHK